MAAGREWQSLGKEVPPSTGALVEVFRSADDYLRRGNPMGCVMQLIRVTMACSESPLKFFGSSGGEAAAWAAAGGAAVCASGRAFPSLLFAKWLSVLQQAADRLPYNEENWQTVLAAVLTARQKLEAAGFSCGPSSTQVEQQMAARLAACRIQQAAAVGPRTMAVRAQQSTAPAAAAAAGQAAGPAALISHKQQQAEQQQAAAAPSTGGRGTRKSAVLARETMAAAVCEVAEEGEQQETASAAAAVGTAGRQRRGGATPAAVQQQQQQQHAGHSPGSDQENVILPNRAAAAPAAAAAAAPQAAKGPLPKGLAGQQQKQALQPSQAPTGSAKRQRM